MGICSVGRRFEQQLLQSHSVKSQGFLLSTSMISAYSVTATTGSIAEPPTMAVTVISSGGAGG